MVYVENKTSQEGMPYLLDQEYIKALKYEVVPALGCTEPISLALASAHAVKHLLGEACSLETKVNEIIEIKGFVSPNLMKNGMGVHVPGTGMVGLPIAAAVGALVGDAEAGLEVLKGVTEEATIAGRKWIEQGKVKVVIEANTPLLFAKAQVRTASDTVSVSIADHHTQVILIEKNGEIISKKEFNAASESEVPYNLSGANVRSIFEFVNHVEFEEIHFILEAALLNNALSEEGLVNEYGLHIARTLSAHVDKGLLSNDLQNQIIIRSTAASDARMGGATLPAMSNSGSGNQGISATMPVVVVADYLGVDEEKRARALTLSHLIAIYIHTKLPKLSALCAVSTAAMGAGAGMAWLLSEGKYETIDLTLSSMVGDIAGIICDGAANSCAMKVSTSASSALKSVLMALGNIGVTGNEGIVSHTADQSIDNLCQLARGSMQQTDVQIIEIMVNKESC